VWLITKETVMGGGSSSGGGGGGRLWKEGKGGGVLLYLIHGNSRRGHDAYSLVDNGAGAAPAIIIMRMETWK